MHICGVVDIMLFSTIKCRHWHSIERSSKVILNSQRLRLRLLGRLGLILAGSGALLFFECYWTVSLFLYISFFRFRCACLFDYVFSFTKRRVYKEGDRDLPEFPSHFQVAKYSVFERVSEKIQISIDLWIKRLHVKHTVHFRTQNRQFIQIIYWDDTFWTSTTYWNQIDE